MKIKLIGIMILCLSFVGCSDCEIGESKLSTREIAPADYAFPATLNRVIDGDTYDLKIRIWESITMDKRIRVLGIDTPELRPRKGTPEEREAEKIAAKAATEYVKKVFADAKSLRFKYGWKTDGFGRALGTVLVTTAEGKEIGIDTLLLKDGHAVVYEK